jgi:uncharacterized protein YbaR (Trm112 family)
MAKQRKKINPVGEHKLFNQVDGICPLCTQPLYYEKNNKTEKKFQIAHIYPLNPSDNEKIILKNVPLLSDDDNSLDNLIPLCSNCHGQFDKPRTVEEYMKLYKTKSKLIEEEKIRGEYHAYDIEDEIRDVLQLLSTDLGEELQKLNYSALMIDLKVDNTIQPILLKKMKNEITDYYVFIRKQFAEMDKQEDGTFDLIASQIKSFYLKIKKITQNQETIYNSIAEWLYNKTGKRSLEACKVVVSFFIQDCEVLS